MSSDGQPVVHQEILIVRRRSSGEDEGHHGAAWKIAYADFMTAMMAFFLVMWLVNSANKKQIVEIAAYFNPIKMSDRVTGPKGVHALQHSEAGATTQQDRPDGSNVGDLNTQADREPPEGRDPSTSQGSNAREKSSRASRPGQHQVDAANEDLFRDPFGTLSRLEAQGSRQSADAPLADLGGVSRDFIADPFVPPRPNELRRTDPTVSDHAETAVPTANEHQTGSGHPAGRAAEAQRTKQADVSKSSAEVLIGQAKAGVGATDAGEASEVRASNPSGIPAGAGKARGHDAKAADAGAIIAEIMRASQLFAPQNRPEVEVTVTPEGLLISLTDRSDFGMFRVGSSVPKPELVILMGEIGKVLANKRGQVAIRGHTDARPYRSDTYDNWRLSSSRAHAAYYMLVRGGLDERRVVKVEGHSDRSPKIVSDPLAPQNRRIEILLTGAIS